MSTQWIPVALRCEVQRRAAGCCEYCQVHEDDVGVPHEPDHIVAEQHRGQTSLDNLAFACFHCNRHKGTNLASIDPETGRPALLFHPRRDVWSDHFRIDGALITPLTPSGRATAALLKFNTAERLESRNTLVQAGRYPV